MALISRLPSSNGDGLSSSKVFTTLDLKLTAQFGDIITQNVLSNSYYPCGGFYYDENEDGTYTAYVYCTNTSSNGLICVYNINNGIATKLKEIKIFDNANLKSCFKLNSDKNSNIVVLSQNSGSYTNFNYITKDTLELKTISRYYNTGVTVINGIIYCSLAGQSGEPYLYTYNEDGSFIKSWDTSIGIIGCNSAIQQDDAGNIYFSSHNSNDATNGIVMNCLNSDGTIKWQKKRSEFPFVEQYYLLSVRNDGVSLWLVNNNAQNLLLLDKDGNIISQTSQLFDSATYYVNNVTWDETNTLIFMQDISGMSYYILDSNLKVLEKFKMTTDNGIPCIYLMDDSLVYFRRKNSLYCETLKMYSEYQKR